MNVLTEMRAVKILLMGCVSSPAAVKSTNSIAGIGMANAIYIKIPDF